MFKNLGEKKLGDQQLRTKNGKEVWKRARERVGENSRAPPQRRKK